MSCQHDLFNLVPRCRRLPVSKPVSVSTKVHGGRQANRQFHGFLTECGQVFSCSINHQTWLRPCHCIGKTTEWAQSHCNHPQSLARINTGQALVVEKARQETSPASALIWSHSVDTWAGLLFILILQLLFHRFCSCSENSGNKIGFLLFVCVVLV